MPPPNRGFQMLDRHQGVAEQMETEWYTQSSSLSNVGSPNEDRSARCGRQEDSVLEIVLLHDARRVWRTWS